MGLYKSIINAEAAMVLTICLRSLNTKARATNVSIVVARTTDGLKPVTKAKPQSKIIRII
ncbi:hypothetical protein AwDysgo_20530 [Bacteroidales bacterium]|nr:hypothetical protein AwDysgo_20530 [Bacteroidales bacterium]